MAFENFSMWRGRLPHWRADNVQYYATFRHRRALLDGECLTLLRCLLKPDARQFDLLIACVLPEATELIFTMRAGPTGRPLELSKVIEKSKSSAGKQIIKKTGEPYPPFYAESYDRIIRDEAEFEERFLAIIEAPAFQDLVDEQDEYPGLWVRDAE